MNLGIQEEEEEEDAGRDEEGLLEEDEEDIEEVDSFTPTGTSPAGVVGGASAALGEIMGIEEEDDGVPEVPKAPEALMNKMPVSEALTEALQKVVPIPRDEEKGLTTHDAKV
jgi:hypothetical protein